MTTKPLNQPIRKTSGIPALAVVLISVCITVAVSALIAGYRLCVDVARPHMMFSPLGCMRPEVIVKTWSTMGLGGLPISIPVGLGIAGAMVIFEPKSWRIQYGAIAGVLLAGFYILVAKSILRGIPDVSTLPNLSRALLVWPQLVPFTTLWSGLIAGIASGSVVSMISNRPTKFPRPITKSQVHPDEQFRIARRQRRLEKGH